MTLSKQDIIQELKEWGISLVQAIKAVCEKKSEQPLFNNVMNYFETLIKDAHTNKKVSALKRIIKEIELWSLSLDPLDLNKVNGIMISKFGKAVGEDNIFKKVNSIIKKRGIKNLKEYRLLSEVLNLYSSDSSKKVIVDSVSRLIFLFEKNNPSKK